MTAISYGGRRLGVVVPSGNSVAEAELRAMLPAEVTMLTKLLALRGSSAAELMAMLTQLEYAAALLGHTEPEVIAFHCTAVSTVAMHLASEIHDRISAATGRRGIATADAILAALDALGARRVLLVAPYVEAVHQREGRISRGTRGSGDRRQLPWRGSRHRNGRDHAGCDRRAGASRCLGRCGRSLLHQLHRSAALIAPLEASLGIPVITSNQVLVWHALRALGMHRHVNGFGRLLSSTTIAIGPSRRT